MDSRQTRPASYQVPAYPALEVRPSAGYRISQQGQTAGAHQTRTSSPAQVPTGKSFSMASRYFSPRNSWRPARGNLAPGKHQSNSDHPFTDLLRGVKVVTSCKTSSNGANFWAPTERGSTTAVMSMNGESLNLGGKLSKLSSLPRSSMLCRVLGVVPEALDMSRPPTFIMRSLLWSWGKSWVNCKIFSPEVDMVCFSNKATSSDVKSSSSSNGPVIHKLK